MREGTKNKSRKQTGRKRKERQGRLEYRLRGKNIRAQVNVTMPGFCSLNAVSRNEGHDARPNYRARSYFCLFVPRALICVLYVYCVVLLCHGFELWSLCVFRIGIDETGMSSPTSATLL